MAFGTKLGTEVVLGKPIEIYVNGKGQFFADMPAGEADADDDDTVTADTKAGLLEALRKRIQKARKKVRIPVTLINHGGRESRYSNATPTRGLKHCFFRGINSRTRQLLMEDDADGKFAVDSWLGDKQLARRFTPEQCERYDVLTAAADAATAALGTFQDEVLVEPKDMLDDLSKADAAAGEDSADS